VDIVSRQKRKQMMSGIRGKNTRPEIGIRKGIHALGFRFRLHVKEIPGHPDIVLPKYKALILVHGCFWHRHACHLFKWPSTRAEFWKKKINGNVKNDEKILAILKTSGWRCLIVWECALKGKTRLEKSELIKQIAEWILSEKKYQEIGGNRPRSRQ